MKTFKKFGELLNRLTENDRAEIKHLELVEQQRVESGSVVSKRLSQVFRKVELYDYDQNSIWGID